MYAQIRTIDGRLASVPINVAGRYSVERFLSDAMLTTIRGIPFLVAAPDVAIRVDAIQSVELVREPS